MLALHGWGRTHRDWLTCLAGFDAAAVDLPGFGATPAPNQAWGAAAYAEAISPVLDECAERVVLVGHSFGGRVALELALRRTDVVASLVLCGVPLLRRADRAAAKPALAFRLVRQMRRLRLVGEGTMEAMRQRYGSADYRAASGIMRDVLVTAVNETYESQLARVSQPVELIWGELDGAVPLEVARRAADALGDAKLTVLDRVGHFVPTEAPEALVAALHRRLAALR